VEGGGQRTGEITKGTQIGKKNKKEEASLVLSESVERDPRVNRIRGGLRGGKRAES